MKKTYIVGNGSSILDGLDGGRAARLPELPPLLALVAVGVGVRVGLCVAVEKNVLLQGRVLVHAIETGHGDDGLGAGSHGGISLDVVAGASHGGKNGLIEVADLGGETVADRTEHTGMTQRVAWFPLGGEGGRKELSSKTLASGTKRARGGRETQTTG